MDDGRIGGEMTLAGIAKWLEKIQSDITAVQSDITAVRSDITAVRSDIKTVDGKVDSLDHKMTVEFEATRGLINLGFESTQILREEVGRRFDATDKKHDEELSLLKAAVRIKANRRPPRRN